MEDEFFLKDFRGTVGDNSLAVVLLNRINNFLYWRSDSGSILKTDLNANIVWEAKFDYTSGGSGGPNIDYVIESHTTNQIILSGRFYDSEHKLFLAKITQDGVLMWEKYYDITIGYLGGPDGLIEPYSNNQFVVRAYEHILIIDDDGNIIKNKRRKITGSTYDIVRGIEVYNGLIYVLYNDPNLGNIAILDGNLNVLHTYRFHAISGFEPRNINAEMRLGRINDKLIIGFRDVSQNVGLIIYDTNDVNSNDAGPLIVKRFNNGYSYDNTANQLYIANNKIYLIGEKSESPPNPGEAIIYRLNENLGIEWIKKTDGFSEVIWFNAFQDFLVTTFKDTSGGLKYRVLKSQTDGTSSCIPFTSFSDSMVDEDGGWTVFPAYTLEDHIATSPLFSAQVSLVTSTKINQLCPQTYDVATSTITALPNTIDADGTSTSSITVQLKDFLGANLSEGGDTVVINTNAGSISTVTDNNNGTYTANLTSSNTAETATLSFTVDGKAATSTVQVVFEAVIPKIVQSPHLYLQSAGSTGNDGSAAGIHLRWLLKKDLAKHLPKGNLASTTVNYNKPDDFVKIYRAPYVESNTTFDLTQSPSVIDDRNAIWVYLVNGIKVYLYFRNKGQYNTIKSTINPLTQHTQFLAAYGNEILELESKNELFFSVSFNVSAGASPVVETELLSVEENKFAAEKGITSRKTFTGTTELSNTRMVTENGRSFRFRLTDCSMNSIALEFYSVLTANIEYGAGWTSLGDFSLSTTDSEVFSRLEPSSDLVNGQWQRYNENAFVNVQNYKDKWNVVNPVTQSNIKQTVQDYVNLSDAADNPSALQSYGFGEDLSGDGVTEADNSFELSNLTLLQQASLDFHVARMLGLGYLDVGSVVQNNDSFVYMAEYETKVTLENGQLVAEDTEHRYITIPTSKADERLPQSIDLKEPVPGLFSNSGVGESPASITDDDGYAQDGKSRYITLYAEEQDDLSIDKGFYSPNSEFNLSENTVPVFVGIEYKGIGETNWRKPELPNTDAYQNVVPSGETAHNETLPLPIPDEGVPLFVHREKESGEHVYGSYGINWFSRAAYSNVQWNITTSIVPKQALVPPSNRNALLIVEESPLVLTSANEQQLLSNISGDDKTLVRLIFDYNTSQELLNYEINPENMGSVTNPLDVNAIFPDSQELYADEVEIYFRDNLPLNITGKAISVTDHPSNEILSIIVIGDYQLDSTGETITPAMPSGSLSNFVGGVFVLEETEYIIHEVTDDPNDGIVFTVYKKQISDKLRTVVEPDANEPLQAPKIFGDGMFMAVENLQNASSWGTPNPHSLKVQIGDNWSVHREVIERRGPDDIIEEFVEKSRGIWDDAVVEEVSQTVGFDGSNQPILEHKGLYKATFSSTQLANHPQSSGANPVQWHKGIIRIHTTGDVNGNRRTLEVVKTENIGTANNLVVYFIDNGFSSDPSYDSIQTGNIQVNYYPGYRIYLYADIGSGLTENTVLPGEGEGIKYTCFGFRTLGNSGTQFSKISVPTVMFAQEVIEPLQPELPIGPLYATRPDGFGKASYTLTTQFLQRPHGILYYRADDDAILNILYKPETVAQVKQEIQDSDSSFLANRWQNLLGFDYDYPSNSYQTDGQFAIYPENVEGYRLPNPDNNSLFDIAGGETPGSIDPGTMVDRIKVAIQNIFVPLTEIPLLYDYINDSSYRPIPKKQVVRDGNGALLSPESPDFDIAPMAKTLAVNQVQFTDFGLDGTSNNLYFYAVKELGNKMQMGDFSPVLGPVKLINTNPPIAPSIKKVVPILENKLLGIIPEMRIEINAYPNIESIKKIALYRTLKAADALSVRSMVKVKELDLQISDQVSNDIWEISDSFEDLSEVPYGDPIYYRALAYREIEYADKDNPNVVITDFVPSETSKLIVSAIVENTNPLAPQITFMGDVVNGGLELGNIVLSWEKTIYKGKYHLYKLNNEGNWLKIFEVQSNDQNISVPLETTDLGTNILPIKNSDNQEIYHHFKIVVENTAGLISQEDKVLTMPLA
ncbi:Ig-like domain-containing protein [Flagellimonas onchidii]|uniref:Ig-like domain-containing protein n=1 Tax=Flagellimonas onchidii TaxID=2562684 RepID=UPI0010A5CC56|nr:Ig-like domain-containing protein [Allomuricauda onchidii]